jgi:hypothetical protein
MIEYQMDFLVEEKTPLDIIRHDMKNIKESSDKVRKSLFARHNELARHYRDLQERMQILERNICRGEITPGM